MSQSSTATLGSMSSTKSKSIALWTFQVALAGLFFMSAFAKLSGDPQMVGLFDAIGIGQWFRILTGATEGVAAVMLLTPALSGVGALLLTGTMAGAIATHVFVLGDSPAFPAVLLVVAASIAWGRRERTLSLLGR